MRIPTLVGILALFERELVRTSRGQAYRSVYRGHRRFAIRRTNLRNRLSGRRQQPEGAIAFHTHCQGGHLPGLPLHVEDGAAADVNAFNGTLRPLLR